jgi:hypothetical protein
MLRGDEPMPRALAEALKPFIDHALFLERLGFLDETAPGDMPIVGFQAGQWRALLAAFEELE